MVLPFVLARPADKFHSEHGKRCRLCNRYWYLLVRPTALVRVASIPVGVATKVPPTNGSVGFGQSVHGELRAYEKPIKML